MSRHTEVVVVGGGYSGVMAANRLTQRDDVTVTLINPRPKFVERIRLHQLVGGSNDAVVDYREILAPTVGLMVDTATRIDWAPPCSLGRRPDEISSNHKGLATWLSRQAEAASNHTYRDWDAVAAVVMDATAHYGLLQDVFGAEHPTGVSA